LPVADYAKHDKPSQSWMIPRGCNKGWFGDSLKNLNKFRC
jgi:hypothetical protein